MSNITYYPSMKEIEVLRGFVEFLVRMGRGVKVDQDTYDLHPIAVVFEPGFRLTVK